MDNLPTAYFDLPEQGYLDWLRSLPPGTPVGVRPSASNNPLCHYLYQVVGIMPRLHTDGKESWFILGLSRTSDEASLRVVLPPWTAPLVASYTMHRTIWHGPQPTQSNIDAGRALDDAGDHKLLQPPTTDTLTRRSTNRKKTT